MGNFARVLHHLDMKNVKKKRLEEIAAQKLKEKKDREEKKIIQEISRKYKSDWKREIYEGMTTANAMVTVLPAEGETAIDQVNPTDSASFADTTNMFGADGNNSALVDATIRASGSGTGSNNGFNVGGDYLAFQGGSGSSRMALLKPMDSTGVDTLTITAIRGTGSNGGEHPDIVGTEELFVIYKTPEMSRSSYLSQDRSQNNVGSFPADAAIIAINQGDGTLQNYTITIPEYARQKDTIFGLFQLGNSGSQFDHYGVTDIKFQRKTPLSVVVPLDSPEATSFVRVGSDEGDPKKRKKKLNDQLAASDEYTSSIMGAPFPGQGGRVDGEDPFKSATVTSDDVINASPIGNDEVKKSFGDYQGNVEKQKAAEVEKLTGELDDLYNNPNATMDDFMGADNVERVETILKLDPNNVEALYTRSFISTLNGDQDAAIVDAEKAYEIDPDNEFTKPTLEYAYSSKISSTWDEAETMGDLMDDTELMNTLDKAIKLNPDDIMNYWYRSTINESNEDLDAVVEDLEKMLEIDPEDSETELRLSQVKQAQAEKIRQEQEAEAERLEKEAREIEEKAYKDYYEDPNWNIEDEIEPIEINNWDKNESRSGILDLYKADYETAKATIANLPKQSETIGATYNGDNIDYVHLSQININIESRDVRFRSPESMSQEELQRNLISLSLTIEDQKYWINDLNRKLELNVVGAPGYIRGGGTPFTGEINGVTAKQIEIEYDKLQDMLRPQYEGDWRGQNEKVNKLYHQRRADNEIRKLNAEQYQLITQYNKLYNAFMGVEGDSTSLNLPDTIQKVLDQNEKFDLSDEERKSIEALMDLPELKSSSDFAKVIGSNLVDPDALKLGYFRLGGAMFNYAVPIAISEVLNRPIFVDDSKIPDRHRNAMRDALQENILSQGKLPTWFAINTTPQPYVDENIRTNSETGKVESNYKNPNLPPGNQPGQIQHIDNLKSKPNVFQPYYDTDEFNPIMGQGGAQYQFVVPEGSDLDSAYMLFLDHAYNNKISPDTNEIAGSEEDKTIYRDAYGDNAVSRWMDKNINLTRMLADGVTAISDYIHRGEQQTTPDGYSYRKGDPTAENSGGMAGYPPNIRGDLITRVKIPLSDFSKEVQDMVLGNPTTQKSDEPKIDEPRTDTPKPKSKPKPRSGIAGLDEPIIFDKNKKNNVKESTLFERLKQKQFFNPNDIKPTFPENPPPQLDPKTGMHPNYGKNSKRFRKLDPISANAMPPTGDPEIDALVDKQRTKPKTKLYDKLKKNIRKDLTNK